MVGGEALGLECGVCPGEGVCPEEGLAFGVCGVGAVEVAGVGGELAGVESGPRHFFWCWAILHTCFHDITFPQFFRQAIVGLSAPPFNVLPGILMQSHPLAGRNGWGRFEAGLGEPWFVWEPGCVENLESLGEPDGVGEVEGVGELEGIGELKAVAELEGVGELVGERELEGAGELEGDRELEGVVELAGLGESEGVDE